MTLAILTPGRRDISPMTTLLARLLYLKMAISSLFRCYFESQVTGQWSYSRVGCQSVGLGLPLPNNAFDNTYLMQALLQGMRHTVCPLSLSIQRTFSQSFHFNVA